MLGHMRRQLRPLLVMGVFGIAALRPSVAMAGMPMPVLSDWAALRFETISFFVVVLLISAAVIRWLWNGLAKDFSKMPRLSYRRTLAAVVLCGLLLMVVLTMIAGARELLTPGAVGETRAALQAQRGFAADQRTTGARRTVRSGRSRAIR